MPKGECERVHRAGNWLERQNRHMTGTPLTRPVTGPPDAPARGLQSMLLIFAFRLLDVLTNHLASVPDEVMCRAYASGYLGRLICGCYAGSGRGLL